MPFISALQGQDPKIDDPSSPLEERVTALVEHARAHKGYVTFKDNSPEGVDAANATFAGAVKQGVHFFLRAESMSQVVYEVTI